MEVRVRDEGHVLFAEAFVVPRDQVDLVERIREATDKARALDWRLHELTITPVRSLPAQRGEAADRSGGRTARAAE